MAFVNDFMRTLALPIADLAKWLEVEHQISVSITIAKWNELTGMKVTVDENSASCDNVEDQTINVKKVVKKAADTTNAAELDPILCQHVFIAGQRKGQQCSTKPKGGKDRCSAHKLKIKANSDGSDEEPVAKKSPKKPVAAKKSPKKPAAKKSPPKKKSSPKKSDDEDEDFNSEDDFSEPARKVPLANKKPEIHAMSDSEDDFSEPARKVPLANKKKVKKPFHHPSDTDSN